MARRFEDKPDTAPEKQTEYRAKLAAMTDTELYQECGSKIRLSAYANNNPTSRFHWQCDACCDESERRDDKTIYSRAHKVRVAANR
jgi:hypothetical protein